MLKFKVTAQLKKTKSCLKPLLDDDLLSLEILNPWTRLILYRVN